MTSASLPLRLSRFALIIAAIALLALAGCNRQVSPEHELDMPATGSVRIVSRQIERSDRRVHWKWSLIGERNWRTASASNTDISLADTYPLNDPDRRGGCNIWECDLVAEKSASGVAWTATIHGSDGATSRSAGTLPAGRSLDSAVSIQLSGDEQPRLPAEVPLASLDGKTLTLQVAA